MELSPAMASHMQTLLGWFEHILASGRPLHQSLEPRTWWLVLTLSLHKPRTPRANFQVGSHKDQHPNHKGLSVQAVYTHFGSGPHDAGTCVVPGSHKVTFPWEWRGKGDHQRAPEDALPALQPLKPDVPPDSVVFFNSRLLHASVCGTGHVCGRPARLGLCVAYAPVARRSEQTRRKKEKAYLQGKCSSHWPCDKFALKPPIKSFQILKGAVSLPPPQPLKERLLLL